MKIKTKTKQYCIFCNRRAEYYNSQIDRYVCCDPYQDCKIFKVIQNHLITCELKYNIHSIYPSENKCHQLTYDICVHRGNFGSHNAKNLKFKADVQQKKVKCKYCKKIAKYIINGKACCHDDVKKCKGYHKWASNVHKKKFRDNPKLLTNMSILMTECQNRPEVKKKKSEAMLILHNEDCNKCKTFQKHYRDGKPGRPFDK